MVSALDSGSSDLDSSPFQGHFVVFLSKTIHSHGASLHLDVNLKKNNGTKYGNLVESLAGMLEFLLYFQFDGLSHNINKFSLWIRLLLSVIVTLSLLTLVTS